MENTITAMYLETRQLPAEQRRKLINIIKEQQAVFKSDIPVHVNTIYSCIEQNLPHLTQTGQVSPAIALDPGLIKIIHEHCALKLKLRQTEIIDFAKSHLHGSNVEKQIVTWKLERSKS